MRRSRGRGRTSALFAALLLAAAPAGCGTGRSIGFGPDVTTRPAADLPDHFLVGSWDAAATREPVPGEDCRSPMVDPRDGTRLRMRRAGAGRADYEVPAGRYGAGPGELLRLECATGRPLGFVPR